MNETTIIDYTAQAMLLVLLISLPPIVLATITGIGISLLQAVTQVQEQTLSFAVKLIVVSVTLLITASWMVNQLLEYGNYVFQRFPYLVR